VSDPFADYGIAVTKPERAPALTGPIKTRAAARAEYAGIVAELHGCEDQDTLDLYLMTIGEQLLQFESEIDFLWSGDGADFLGLHREIEAAKFRVSA
jgi:hypothetical protein